MAGSSKKIAAGVITIGVLLTMTACAATETSYKFHPALGICDVTEELYEAENPMQELDTEYDGICCLEGWIPSCENSCRLSIRRR